MKNNRFLAAVFVSIAGAVLAPTLLSGQTALDPARMARIGSVDERFQSYNIEMVEVIGGRFWKPYGQEVDAMLKAQSAAKGATPGPVGMDPNLYQQRTPIDLTNPKLRKLATGLSPAFMRVSGTWANTTYFQDSDTSAAIAPPKGFNGVLTRQQWKGVVDFSNAVNAKIVSSVSTSPGTRNAEGVWSPDQASSLYAYTKSIGGKIAATEFMNEPTFAAMGGAPKGYDAAAYRRDLAAFKPFLKHVDPDIIFLGPGSVGESGGLAASPIPGMIASADLLKATGDVYDAFSYHYYGGASMRCAILGSASQTTETAALSEAWLSQTDQTEKFYADLRDQYAPGKPMWLTETADAACGGNPWASTFTDSFRYLHQLGSLAKSGVQVVMHNTLASSDYGLVDEKTLTPRPNYWAALLWRKVMGATVLEAEPAPIANLYVYGHCLRNHPGGVALLILNTDPKATAQLSLPIASERYTLSANKLGDTAVQLNGKTLAVNAAGDLPNLAGVSLKAGTVSFAPQTITFLALENANNNACRAGV